METTSSAKTRDSARQKLTKPVSIRFTQEEIAELKRKAGEGSLSKYVRSQLFAITSDYKNSNNSESRLSPQMRQKLLAQILIRLGSLDSVHNANELMQAIQTGLIDASPEFANTLASMAVELKKLRHDLLKALGLRP